MITATDSFRTASFVPVTHNRRAVCATTSCDACLGSNSVRRLPFGRTSLSALPNSLLISSNENFDMFLLPDNPLLSPLVVVVLALVLLVSAQSFINTMLEGDQGLGAFLKDGSGYNRSGYKPSSSKDSANENENKDPLPWLKLPQLDFVEVAGQSTTTTAEQSLEEQEEVYQELDRLREELNRELQIVRRRRLEGMTTNDGNDEMAKAKVLRAKLESLMRAYGIEYETDE